MHHRFLQRASSGLGRRKPSDDRYPHPGEFWQINHFLATVDHYCRTMYKGTELKEATNRLIVDSIAINSES